MTSNLARLAYGSASSHHAARRLTSFLGSGIGGARWHCYVIRVCCQDEPGVILPFVTPGVEGLYYSSTNRQAAFSLTVLETVKEGHLNASQFNPDYFRQLRHDLSLPQRFWRVGLA